MYFKEQRYEKSKAVTLAATHTLQLPETGLLDSLSMYFYTRNASDPTASAPWTLWHHITKIEVIGNTDKSLFSMTGEEALAKAYRKMGALPPFKHVETGNAYQDLTIPIFFGRKFKDGKYALDLSAWDKVELKITNDESTTEMYSATSLSIDTRLCTIEDSVEAHPKFLKQWEYETEKPAADAAYVRPKLPSKGLLRSLMIQLDPDLTATTAAVAQDPASDNYNWKLWFKDRALTIIDSRPRDIMRDEHRRLGMGHSCLKAYPSTTRYTDYHWAEVLAVAFAPDTTATTITAFGGSRDRYQAPVTAGNCSDYQAITLGCGLFHTFEIPFYLPDDEETNYLNLETYKPVEIEWYGYKDDNTHRIILEKPIGQGPGEFA
jgi:hypothetical protein